MILIPRNSLRSSLRSSQDFSNNKYKVKLNYGLAYLNPASVYCSVLPIETSTLHEQVRMDRI